MPDNNKPHLLLKNRINQTNQFIISRGMDPDDNVNPERNPELYADLKESFRYDKEKVIVERKARLDRKSLDIPCHIEYIKIYFFRDFDNSLREYFEKAFGLAPVFYEDLNQTITLSITDDEKFDVFLEELELFINSDDTTQPRGKSYAILINISKFKFLTSQDISQSIKTGTVAIHLVDSLRIIDRFDKVQKSLKEFLETNEYEWGFVCDDIIEVKNVNENDYDLLVDNFDIIESVTSFKIFRRYPGTYGDSLISQYDINLDNEAPLVGVIDTGVSNTQLLENIIVDMGLDLTNFESPRTYIDNNGHGTAMAGLVAYGKQLYEEDEENEVTNDARIVPIKVMSDGEDSFSINDLIYSIRFANTNGVRIFSLSINLIRIKKYNENISHYAYLLDKLSHELDILIFISTGNLDREFVEEYFNKHEFEYPRHFFNPNCPEHEQEAYECSETNICSPADSMNNITVGAIPDNFELGQCDVSLDKKLPAYYSKKWHISPNFPVNGSRRVKKSQFNKNIFKPDVLNAGGDMLSIQSAMKVASNDFTEPYARRSGSSLSTPLTANMAAKILKIYPSLKMQTVKALIVNSSEGIKLKNLNHFKNLILDIKKRHSLELIGKEFNNLDELDKNEKSTLSRYFNIGNLEKSLTGFGIPIEDKALVSKENRVTLVVEDTVKTASHYGFYINLPDSIKNLASNANSSIFKISATLTYSFEPIYGNSLAYNPLHIAFNILNDINMDLQQTLDLVSDRGEGHERAFYKGKSSLVWSDEFYPLNAKPFSNCQKIERKVSSKDLLTLMDNFVVLIRCNTKTTAISPAEQETLKNQHHPFSMIITVEEVGNKISGNLYDDIANINTVESIIDVDSDLDLILG